MTIAGSVCSWTVIRLQWGRARVSAEIFTRSIALMAAGSVLQWGRARVSAEILAGNVPDGVPVRALQWGRARVSAEIFWRARRRRRAASCFNGAALV